jgi:hypothetical protein
MTEQTLGGTLYEAWIAKEGRARLDFKAGRRRKAITNIDELRALCTSEHSAAFADDATPLEMVDAWLTFAPAKSDADSVKELFAGEGCVFAFAVPFVLIGYAIGSIFRMFGMDVRNYFRARPSLLPCWSFLPSFAAGGLLPAFQTDWPLALLLVSCVATGIIIGLDSRTLWENAAAFVGVIALFVGIYSAVLYETSPWWAGGFAIAVGTGYGATRSPGEFTAKRPKKW